MVLVVVAMGEEWEEKESAGVKERRSGWRQAKRW